jgi:alkylation response protein AidB-like acyl-CoA dehydrogenase
MGGMIALDELRDAAEKAFPRDQLMPPREASWQIVAELGWLMIDLAEEDGGLGLGAEATAAILFEQGRVLSPAPLIPALLGLKAIAASDVAGKADWVERICGGEYVPLNLLSATVEVGTDGSLTGVVPGVFEADLASHLLAGLADRYVLIPLDAAGVTVTERPLWDESRRVSDIELSGVQPDLALATSDAAKALHDLISPAAQLALAADALGGANAVLELTIEYLKLRRQFDRPLALFQALKHRVADCKVKIAAAEALLWTRAGQAELSPVEAGALKALATQVYAEVAEEAVQLHGGIGLTQEHPCHLFLKRAFLNRTLCGDGDHWNAATGRAALMAMMN